MYSSALIDALSEKSKALNEVIKRLKSEDNVSINVGADTVKGSNNGGKYTITWERKGVAVKKQTYSTLPSSSKIQGDFKTALEASVLPGNKPIKKNIFQPLGDKPASAKAKPKKVPIDGSIKKIIAEAEMHFNEIRLGLENLRARGSKIGYIYAAIESPNLSTDNKIKYTRQMAEFIAPRLSALPFIERVDREIKHPGLAYIHYKIKPEYV